MACVGVVSAVTVCVYVCKNVFMYDHVELC